VGTQEISYFLDFRAFKKSRQLTENGCWRNPARFELTTSAFGGNALSACWCVAAEP
jgi:hypothetical protein